MQFGIEHVVTQIAAPFYTIYKFCNDKLRSFTQKNLFPLLQQHFQFHALVLEPLVTLHFHTIPVLVLSFMVF